MEPVQTGAGFLWFQSMPSATAVRTPIPSRKSLSPRSADTTKLTSSQEGQIPVRDIKVSESNRDQCYLAPSEPHSSTTASHGYPNTHVKQDFDIKSHLMMMIEDFKKDISNILNEIQKNR